MRCDVGDAPTSCYVVARDGVCDESCGWLKVYVGTWAREELVLGRRRGAMVVGKLDDDRRSPAVDGYGELGSTD